MRIVTKHPQFADMQHQMARECSACTLYALALHLIDLYVYVYICIYLYTCIYVYVYVQFRHICSESTLYALELQSKQFVSTCVCIYIYVYVYVYVSVCRYMYTCIHVYRYVEYRDICSESTLYALALQLQ